MRVFDTLAITGRAEAQLPQPLLSEKSGLSDIKQNCLLELETIGYDYFCYQGYFPMFGKCQYLYGFPNFGSTDEDYAKNCFEGPIASYCRTETTPRLWKDFHPDSTKDANALKELQSRATSQGIHNGQCFPVHGAGSEWAVLNVANKQKNTGSTSDTIKQLQLLAMSVHEAIKQLNDDQIEANTYRVTALSPREIECLDWTAAGKTAWEIARIIGITESTVSFHIRNTINKLNASNRSHAVAVAMARSLINAK